MNSAPLFGLVLAGGASSRMRTDKAALLYDGETQLQRSVALLSRHVAAVYVSVRPTQTEDPLRSGAQLIVDAVPGEGPIVGIRSALLFRPDRAWLVLACDLPFLSDAVLNALIANRDPGALATAYASSHDGLPEPLCAIWEPAAGPALAAYQEGGGRCPRKFLIRNPARLLPPKDPRALDNVNTPEEYAAALDALRGAGAATPIRLEVQYFALMREQAGLPRESVQTMAPTPAALFAELTARHRFTLGREQLKVASNGEFGVWTHPLRDGDVVVFIPPVAGG